MARAASRVDKDYSPEAEAILTETIASFYDDPLGFVLYAFPWGVEGTELEDEPGPDVWQAQQLLRIGDAIKADPEGYQIQEATASGHSIGKGIEVSQPAKRVILSSFNAKEAYTMEDIKWGDLQVGDYVFGKDGVPTRIKATRRYRLEHFRVTFDDGSSTVVSGEHEWSVRGRQERRRKISRDSPDG